MKLAKPGITETIQSHQLGILKPLLVKVFGTGFGTGYTPFAQGTFGSALAVLLWWLFAPSSKLGQLLTIAGIHVVSIPLSGWGEKLWGHDPGRITIDEFAGQAIALFGVRKNDYKSLVLAFLLFRLFDVFKLPWVRNHVETMPGGMGVTLDDSIAGVFARISLFAVNRMGKSNS